VQFIEPARRRLRRLLAKRFEAAKSALLSGRDMSKKAAIFYAVSAQLAAQSRPLPNLAGTLREALGIHADTEATVQQHRNSARTFLATVAVRLRGDEPPMNFRWSAIGDGALDEILWLLVDRIDENTETIKDAQPGKDAPKSAA
jgi:hypothetical protein